MIRTLKFVSLVSLSALGACGNSDEGTEKQNVTVPSATDTSTSMPGPATGTAGPQPVQSSPTQPSGSGSAQPNPTTSTTMPPNVPSTGPTPSTTGGPAPTPTPSDTSGPAPTPSDTETPPTETTGEGNSEPTGSNTDRPAPTATDTTPDGPPAGAYEACSGAEPPALKLTPVITDLDNPIYITFPTDDPDTMFVVLRGGELRRYDMTQDPPAYVTLLEVVTSTENECGFLSIALHPKFDGQTEKRIYVSYMPTCPASIFAAGGSSTLDEYSVEGDMATYTKTLLELDQPQGNHNGGLAKFGPDGYLYFGLGDGGGGNDTDGHAPNGNGQDVTVPLGKLLRFDVDNLDQAPAGNLTAADVGGAEVDSRILHYGLRNPWRWSFDQLNGDLYIGDVGQDTWEEIDYLKAGTGPTNFGWSAREGKVACTVCNHTVFPEGSTPFEPIHVYATNAGGSGFFKGSVIGGYVYRGSNIPGLYGRYLFAEFVRSNIFALSVDENGAECDVVEDLIPGADIPDQSISSFGQDPNGEVYVLNMTRGEILRIDADE